MVKRARTFRLGTIAVALATGGCIAVFGLDPLSEGVHADEAGAPDGGAPDGDGGDASPPPPPPTCAVDDIGLAPRPAISPADAGLDRVLFAVMTLDLGINPNADPPGFDLDRRGERTSCAPPDSGISKRDGGDGTGVDNASFRFLQSVGVLFPSLTPAKIGARLEARYFGLVFGLYNWNGTPNDKDVLLALFPTLNDVAGDGGTWRPDERFLINAGSELGSDEGWITEGRLVARFETLTIPIRSSNDEVRSFDIALEDAWVTAKLDGSKLVEGTIGGRLRARDLLHEVSLLYNDAVNPPVYVCDSVNDFKPQVCEGLDLRGNHCDDFRDLPCDALSFGARFEASEIEELGESHLREDEEYRTDPGRLPPSERCPGAPVFDCP